MPAKHLLLVEGQDDFHVFQHLCEQHQLPEEFTLEDGKGIDRILEGLEVRLTIGSAVERLGIVVDADTNIESRWEALRNILLKAGYAANNVPRTPDPNGTIIEQDDRRVRVVGIWLMPDNAVSGMLENFIAFLVRPDDALWNRAIEVVDQLPEYRFPIGQKSKAQIHTWLAWQEKPGLPMGLAIKAQYLQADALPAQQLMSWLRRLFALNTDESQPTPP